MEISVKYLNNLIDEALKSGKKPEKLLIGYKAYAELMDHPKFSDEVMNSAMTPDKRKYKKIKIKVTTEEYQLEVKS
ncbi:MAG: hypothetical protein LKF82_06395 [Acinetobacter populi]|jgi:hypothetical protein|uniref:hypothetical protein n=1 Tax=Acinetobacter populi TaxID=1582270 RepID=UPI0023540EDC|nr:hypothetical protein [Acinetobacter populi]MCH4247454.1 hypothetical protein [Acinetobacter populi]